MTTTLDTSAVRRWKQYPEYIATDALWVPSVPNGWQVMRLKHLAASPFQYGANEPGGDTDRSAPRFVRITDIDERGQLREETFCTLSRGLAQPYLLRKGDILFARSGATVGKTFLYQKSWGEACYAGYLIRFQPRLALVRPEFVSYFTGTEQYRGWVAQQQLQATIQNISAEKYANLTLPLPSLPEQRAIVAFLDRETARIDALIGHKERLIALLEEKRQAVISHAVTRGLDPAAPLKDSGVPWLGMVPMHWEIRRLKHISPGQLVGVVVNPSSYVDELGDIPFLFGSNVISGAFSLDGVRRITAHSNKQISKSILQSGDLVTVRVGAPGVTAVIPKELDGCNCASIMIIRRGRSFDSHWLCYAMNSIVGKTNVELAQYGAAQEQFNISHAVDFLFPVPPLLEQVAIVANLHRQCESVDHAVGRIRDGIARLQEYRTALISAAVTGQIDVRGEVTP